MTDSPPTKQSDRYFGVEHSTSSNQLTFHPYRNVSKLTTKPQTPKQEHFRWTQKALQQPFLDRVEAASGKPVLLQCDSNFGGHALVKIPNSVLFRPKGSGIDGFRDSVMKTTAGATSLSCRHKRQFVFFDSPTTLWPMRNRIYLKGLDEEEDMP